MYKKIKIPFLYAFAMLTTFAAYNYFHTDEFLYFGLEIQLGLVSGIILFYFLPRNLKNDFSILSWTSIGFAIILLGINIWILKTQLQSLKNESIIKTYSSLNCEQIKLKFDTDLKNGKLKYFSYGIAEPIGLEDNLAKIDIENFFQGCMISKNLICYNALVENYIKKKYQLKIRDL